MSKIFGINDIQKAISARDIDKLIFMANKINTEDITAAIKLYESFYIDELDLSTTIFRFIQNCHCKRGYKFNSGYGLYTFELAK